jgi:hypothetical protein
MAAAPYGGLSSLGISPGGASEAESGVFVSSLMFSSAGRLAILYGL